MKYLLFATVIAVFGCSSAKIVPAARRELPENISLNGKLFSTLFQQRAAEYRALCFQGYNIAMLRIDNFKNTSGQPLALITDIDETILDNSPYAVHQAFRGKEFESATWSQWVEMASADTLPGAATFLRYAASKNVEIFYISNRSLKEGPGTLRNLQRFNLPNADEAHMLLRGETGSKEPRRSFVAKTHEIVLLMGDNLADFSKLWDIRTEDSRRRSADISAAEFGNRFIVFPNVNYGDWEAAFYNLRGATQAQMDSILRTKLKGY